MIIDAIEDGSLPFYFHVLFGNGNQVKPLNLLRSHANSVSSWWDEIEEVESVEFGFYLFNNVAILVDQLELAVGNLPHFLSPFQKNGPINFSCGGDWEFDDRRFSRSGYNFQAFVNWDPERIFQ